MNLPAIRKYPRTRHIEGSRLQSGDEDLSQVPFAEIEGRQIVVEEKLDGANCAIRFAPTGELLIQSRGHYLTGGSAFEAQFDLVKAWAQMLKPRLSGRLGTRYVVYAECMQKKHTIFYDRLPHYFMEFDVLDLEADRFLSTPARHQLLADLPIVSVPVLHRGPLRSIRELLDLVRSSRFKSAGWRDSFERAVRAAGLDLDRAWTLVEDSDLSEGLYIKVEKGRHVEREAGSSSQEARFKWIRKDFHQRILDANEQSRGHVGFQPMIANQLAPDVDLWTD